MRNLSRYTIVVLLVMGLVSEAKGQLDFFDLGFLKFESLGVGAGFVSVSEDIGTTWNAGGRVVSKTPVQNLNVSKALRLWVKSESEETEFLGAPFKTEIRFFDIALETDAQYHLGSEETQMSPFVQAGLGINYVLTEVTVTVLGSSSSVTSSDSKIGINIGGGVELKISDSLKGYLDGKYIIVSNLNQFNVQVGILF